MSYVQLDRRYAVWNVFATPEFSLQLREWCFPVAGCVRYRGYFRESAAHDYASRLAAADDIIMNTGTLDELAEKVQSLHETYLALAAGN